MKPKARLVIPSWGTIYVRRVVNVTIPALLAPGNLPALLEDFDVEVVLLSKRVYFPAFEAAPAFQKLSQLCRVELRAIDHVVTRHSSDYGIVLSYALYAGFIDLGEAMTDTWLLFLNADFILADGSYRTLGRLMKEGKRVIHAPSFRATMEEMLPLLESRIDPATGALAMSTRDMARLALDHRHVTVRGRTVNQQLYHQWRMDQYYWHIDEDTLVGYQWPVALVAIRPERVVLEPTLMWDYAFVPDAAPTLPRHFIGDSDDFFMLEPQQKTSGLDMMRLGGITFDEIARDLSIWTTKEQRECGRELLVIHSGDLPEGMDATVARSRRYLDEIERRLKPALPHVEHPLFISWVRDVKARIRAMRDGPPPEPTGSLRHEYRSLGASIAVMPTDPHDMSGEDGAVMMGIEFTPKSVFSKLAFELKLNAYSPTDNEVVVAIFRNGQPYPLGMTRQELPANTRVDVELSFDHIAWADILPLEVRIGPVRPGVVHINGPERAPRPTSTPYLSIVDLGPVEQAGSGAPPLKPDAHLAPTGHSTVRRDDALRVEAAAKTPLLKCEFVPRSSQSVLRAEAAVEIAASAGATVGLALFRTGDPSPLQTVTAAAGPDRPVRVALTAEFFAGRHAAVAFELRVLASAPADVLAGATLGIRDQGDIGIDAGPLSVPAPPTHDVGRCIAHALRAAGFSARADFAFRYPLSPDVFPVARRILALAEHAKRAVEIGGSSTYFAGLVADRIAIDDLRPDVVPYGSLDLCVCELTLDEARDFRDLYGRLRPFVRNGGRVLLFVQNRELMEFSEKNLFAFKGIFPEIDESRIHFIGGRWHGRLLKAFSIAQHAFRRKPVLARAVTAIGLCACAPAGWLLAAFKRIDGNAFQKRWTSFVVELEVRRRARPAERSGG